MIQLTPVGVGQLTDTVSSGLELDGATSVFVQGNYAYVAASFDDDGLQVIDISDPTNPVGVGQLRDTCEFSIEWGEFCFCSRELCVCSWREMRTVYK